MSKSPDAFRTISEVATWLGVQAHVLRFWESKFSQIKPVKRAGGRRYYRPSDMRLIGGIKTLLHDDGLTIKGVQKILREKGVAHVAGLSPSLEGEAADEVAETGGTVLAFKAKPAPAPPTAASEATASKSTAPAPEPVPVPEQDKPADVAPPAGLPSFLNRAETPAPARRLVAPVHDPRRHAPDRPATEAPAEPREAEPPYTPGPLGHLAGLTALSPRQAAQIAPLARALRAWYDHNEKAGWG